MPVQGATLVAFQGAKPLARYALASVFGHQKHIWLSYIHNTMGNTPKATKRPNGEAILQFSTVSAKFKIWLLNRSPPTLKLSALLIGKLTRPSGNLAQSGLAVVPPMMLWAASMIVTW